MLRRNFNYALVSLTAVCKLPWGWMCAGFQGDVSSAGRDSTVRSIEILYKG